MRKLIAAAVLSAAPMLAVAQAASGEAGGATPERIEVLGDWAVFATDNPRECFATSRAKDESGWTDPAGAPQSQILVTFRPEPADHPGEVSFWTGGRPIAPGTTLTVRSGGAEFLLFTDGEWAWPPDSPADAAAIAAMSQAESAQIDLIAADMAQVRVAFSLAGFAEAVAHAANYCATVAPAA